jgi:hypothetical protein
MADTTQDFSALVKAAGIPTTEAELRASFTADLYNSALGVTNINPLSPFWLLITNLFVKPVLWLIQGVMIGQVLPQLFLRTATGAYLNLLAWAYAVERKPAIKAQMLISFSRRLTTDVMVIPAGMVVLTPAVNGKIYAVRTLAAATFPNGEQVLKVLAEALEEGVAYNLPSGYYTILREPIDGIDCVFNDWDSLVVPGADAESDEGLRMRCRNQFNTLGHYHTNAVYKSLIASFPGVSVENIFFVNNAPRGPGTANAYILFAQGEPSQTYIDSINNYISGGNNRGHGDDMQVFLMPTAGQTLTLDWWPLDTLAVDEMLALGTKIETFIRAAFRENAAYKPTLVAPQSTFSFSRLAGELHATFSGIKTLKFANADIVSAVNVPVISSILITRR